jgi:DNA-binding NtrC family response regulator
MKKILVVDDNTSIVRSLAHILKKEGHKVDTAYNGKEGINKIDEGQYDLVISDVIMPEKDGQDIANHINQSDHKIPLIIITGGGSLLTKDMAIEIAKKHSPYFLKKPFDGQALKDKMAEVFAD